ncbi:MAG: hypothetical protein JJ971_06020 [Balneolaceae bacterium]|nr:hypothetical protein [Balneolaceae bacterium]MBO6545934.1 hypothetical protein [Balneolaceae bacterium]MBO6647330.1 hypothetical protein [Balneolaceae bacterium]
MKYLLFLVVPIISTFALLFLQKLGENYWQKQHSDSSASDLDQFYNKYGQYNNSKDFRVYIKKEKGKGYDINYGNPILIIMTFLIVISFPIVNSFIRDL